jgi:hypothetical protein
MQMERGFLEFEKAPFDFRQDRRGVCASYWTVSVTAVVWVIVPDVPVTVTV